MTDVTGAPRTGAARPRALGSRTPLRGRHLAWKWLGIVTAAEILGFATVACAGALTADAAGAVPSLLAAGAVEGAILGGGQAIVLRYALPELSRRRWVAATAGAAVLAYLLGLVPSTYADPMAAWPPALLAVAVVVLSCGLLASIGMAQWLILRRHVERAWRWIFTTAAAWLVGLSVFLGFSMPLWRSGQPLVLIVMIGVVGGLLMAATTAAITGFALARILRS